MKNKNLILQMSLQKFKANTPGMNLSSMELTAVERILVRTKRFTNLSSLTEREDTVIVKCPVAYLQIFYKIDIVPSTNSMKFIPQQTIYGFKTIISSSCASVELVRVPQNGTSRNSKLS